MEQVWKGFKHSFPSLPNFIILKVETDPSRPHGFQVHLWVQGQTSKFHSIYFQSRILPEGDVNPLDTRQLREGLIPKYCQGVTAFFPFQDLLHSLQVSTYGWRNCWATPQGKEGN